MVLGKVNGLVFRMALGMVWEMACGMVWGMIWGMFILFERHTHFTKQITDV